MGGSGSYCFHASTAPLWTLFSPKPWGGGKIVIDALMKSKSGYQHWKNYGQALDFVHVFSATDMKERMAHLHFSDHELYGATLCPFVVMQNHFHFISRLPKGRDVGWFVQRIKANSARHLKPLLMEDQLEALATQSGLNGRSFWQRSFRSMVLEGEGLFLQKANYIHLNPVRAGIARNPGDYRWSSAGLYLRGVCDEVSGVNLAGWRSVHSGAVEA